MIKACLENNTFEEIVTHLAKELKLNGLEAPDKLKVGTVHHYATNLNADRPKPNFHDSKKPGPYRSQCRQLNRQKKRAEDAQKNPGTKNKGAQQQHKKQKKQ